MPNKRKELLINGEIYHVYNRSIGNEDILTQTTFLKQYEKLIEYYRFNQKMRFSKFTTLQLDIRKQYKENYQKSSPIAEILAFSLMPDHYHLLLKQKKERGIASFVSNIQNSFAKYFNLKRDRHGSLFQKPFKSRRIANDEILMHVSRYIHLNPVTSFLIGFDDLKNYRWTSYKDYMNAKNNEFVETDFILKLFGSNRLYSTFVKNQVDYQRKLGFIKKYMLE